MEPFTLLKAIEEWLPRNRQLKTYHVGEQTLPYLNRFYCIECSICWINMGWVLSDCVVTRETAFGASDPEFFSNLKSHLLKHQRKCSTQK